MSRRSPGSARGATAKPDSSDFVREPKNWQRVRRPESYLSRAIGRHTNGGDVLDDERLAPSEGVHLEREGDSWRATIGSSTALAEGN